MATNFDLKKKRKIIAEPVEKQEMWIFVDTEYRVDKKVVFTWNILFQAFQDKEFQVLIHDDPSTKLSKGIYINIINPGLHRAATRTPILPCSDVIEWITRRVDHEKREILNFKGKSVASYQALVLNQLYHFKEAHVKVTPEWQKL